MQDFHFLSTEPSAPLDAAVEMFLCAKGRIPGETEKILPHGKVALGLSLDNRHGFVKRTAKGPHRSFHASWFTGLQTSPLYHHPPATTHVHGIIFDPLAFSEMFPQNMAVWRDLTVEAPEAVGASLGRRLQRLCRQPSEVGAIHRDLEEVLLSRWSQRKRHPDWLWQGYRQICERQGSLRLADLYRQVEVSGRHFNQTFQAAVGVSPKVLCRVLRLNVVLAAVDPGRELNWSHLAHEADYSDQAHFNRDFKHFTGLTPRQYAVARQAGYGELQPGEDVSFVPDID
jgi:AraC-like DNA-binding protein